MTDERDAGRQALYNVVKGKEARHWADKFVNTLPETGSAALCRRFAAWVRRQHQREVALVQAVQDGSARSIGEGGMDRPADPISTEGPTDPVERIFGMIQADRPTWRPTRATLDLWKEEFDGEDPELLMRAAKAYIRTSSLHPKVAVVKKELMGLKNAEAEKPPTYWDQRPEGEGELTPRTLARHPWYDPTVDWDTLQVRCREWREKHGAYDASGTFRPGETQSA